MDLFHSSVGGILRTNRIKIKDMSKYFEINGYWKDDKSEFNGLIVKEYDDVGEDDDDVFFYGLSEEQIKEAIDSKGEDDSLDFIITSYKEL